MTLEEQREIVFRAQEAGVFLEDVRAWFGLSPRSAAALRAMLRAIEDLLGEPAKDEKALLAVAIYGEAHVYAESVFDLFRRQLRGRRLADPHPSDLGARAEKEDKGS